MSFKWFVNCHIEWLKTPSITPVLENERLIRKPTQVKRKLIGSYPSIDDKKLRVINQLANKKPIRGV